jgi:hypothetical protein
MTRVQCAQVNAFVPKLLEIHCTPGLDERHDTADVLRAVETDSCINPAIVHIARQITIGLQAATYDELVPLRVESGVLQVRVVLVRPEPMDLVVRDALAKHVARGSGALLDSVLPVLHSDVATDDGMIVIRNVTAA